MKLKYPVARIDASIGDEHVSVSIFMDKGIGEVVHLKNNKGSPIFNSIRAAIAALKKDHRCQWWHNNNQNVDRISGHDCLFFHNVKKK